MLLEISQLHARASSEEILKGVSLQVAPGEIHAIMGPNGSGKSTLARVIAGHPDFEVTSGEIIFGENKNFTSLPPHERALNGLFLGFQYPVEVPGVRNRDLLQESYNQVCAHQGAAILSEEEFDKLLTSKLNLLKMAPDFLERSVNSDFSGGEKKKNEVLQMLILSPCLAILDEIDSGLDIDALKILAKALEGHAAPHNALILVTHYQRLLEHIRPHRVHVMSGGAITCSGGPQLAQELEKKGYSAFS